MDLPCTTFPSSSNWGRPPKFTLTYRPVNNVYFDELTQQPHLSSTPNGYHLGSPSSELGLTENVLNARQVSFVVHALHYVMQSG